jgi:hypothetical protein
VLAERRIVVDVLLEKITPAVVVAPERVIVVATFCTPVFCELKTATEVELALCLCGFPQGAPDDQALAVLHTPPPAVFQYCSVCAEALGIKPTKRPIRASATTRGSRRLNHEPEKKNAVFETLDIKIIVF